MRKIIVFLVISLMSMSFIGQASAGEYDYQANDKTRDVLEENIDITYAKTEEKDENLLFTLKVAGNIIPDNYTISYRFLVESLENNKKMGVHFRNYYNAFVGEFTILQEVNYSIEDSNSTLIITVPKIIFDEIKTPWDVNVSAKIKNVENDFLELKKYTPTEKNETEENLNEGNGDQTETPGFEILLLFLSFITLVILKKRKKL